MTELIDLLHRIRDGHADASTVERARALVRGDSRIDDGLREIALTDEDDLPGDAAGLLAVLGADDLAPLLAAAVAAEAGPPPTIDEAALNALPWTYGPAVAAAVRAEAGRIEIADAVLAELELEEALSPNVVAAAVRSEARGSGTARDLVALDLVDAVMAEVAPEGRSAMPRATVTPVEATPVPAAANDSRAFAAASLLLAAAAALFVVFLRPGSPVDDPLPPLAFAHADEVVVEDLSSDADVMIMQGSGPDGTVILWVDEET